MTHRLSALVLILLPVAIQAQPSAEQPLLGLLTGGTSLQWAVVGTEAAPGTPCRASDRYYTFQHKPAQVVVHECLRGSWTPTVHPLTTWTADGKSGVAFGGLSYEVKELHAAAPVCKGRANCVRLASRPDGTTDATTTIYLTR